MHVFHEADHGAEENDGEEGGFGAGEAAHQQEGHAEHAEAPERGGEANGADGAEQAAQRLFGDAGHGKIEGGLFNEGHSGEAGNDVVAATAHFHGDGGISWFVGRPQIAVENAGQGS